MNEEPKKSVLQKQEALEDPAPRCATCEIEILWEPTIYQGWSYCCRGCAEGGPCTCDYSQYPSINISGVIHYLSGEKPEA